MKRFKLLTIISATLAACTTAPTTEMTPNPNQGQVPITFASNTLEVSTRAQVGGATPMAKDHYVVMAIIEFPEARTFTVEHYGSDKTKIVTEEIKSKYNWYFVEHYADGVAESGNTYFWPVDGSELHFFAFWSDYLSNRDTDMAEPMSLGGTDIDPDEQNMKNLAELNMLFPAESVMANINAGTPLTLHSGMMGSSQDDILVAQPQMDVIYNGDGTPDPVALTFNHTTAKVNIRVRLDDELSKTYQINNVDDYHTNIEVDKRSFDLCIFTEDSSKWLVTTDYDNGLTSTFWRHYYVLPQSTIAPSDVATGDLSIHDEYEGMKIGIDDLDITLKGTNTPFNADFNGSVDEYTLQPGDVTGDALKAGVEYTFTLVLHSLDLDKNGNIPFDRDIIGIEMTTNEWVPSEDGDQSFDQDLPNHNPSDDQSQNM